MSNVYDMCKHIPTINRIHIHPLCLIYITIMNLSLYYISFFVFMNPFWGPIFLDILYIYCVCVCIVEPGVGNIGVKEINDNNNDNS